MVPHKEISNATRFQVYRTTHKKNWTLFYKKSLFDPCPENYLSFSEKSPPKIV